MSKYIRTIEAVQWRGDNVDEIVAFVHAIRPSLSLDPLICRRHLFLFYGYDGIVISPGEFIARSDEFSIYKMSASDILMRFTEVEEKES